MTYTIVQAKELYSAFDKNIIVSTEFINLFNTIRVKNKFNPTKFSRKTINYNNWQKSLTKEEEGKKNERDIMCEKIRNLLNKCTNSNYKNLMEKLDNYIETQNTDDMLNVTLDNVFNMAIVQSIYCPVYVKICEYLFEKYGEIIKKQLLAKCKQRFANQKKIEECDDEDEYDLFCKVMKQKKQFVGVFMLVAHLYKEGMVESIVVEKYLDLLLTELTKKLDHDTKIAYVECLKTLFTTVYSKMSKEFNETEEKAELFQTYKDRITEFSSRKDFANREKFMFLDILDLFP